MKRNILTIILFIINIMLSLTCWFSLIIYGDTNYNNGSIDMDIDYRNNLFKKVFTIVILAKLIFFVLSYIKIKKMYSSNNSDFVWMFLLLFIVNMLAYNYNLVGTIAYVNYEDGTHNGYSIGYKDAEEYYKKTH